MHRDRGDSGFKPFASSQPQKRLLPWSLGVGWHHCRGDFLGETSYFLFLLRFSYRFIAKPIWQPAAFLCMRRGAANPTPPALGDGAPSAGLAAAKIGPFCYRWTRAPSSSSSLIPKLRELWPSASVADELRSSGVKGETAKYAAEPWGAAASWGLAGYKTLRSIFDCPGTERLHPVLCPMRFLSRVIDIKPKP